MDEARDQNLDSLISLCKAQAAHHLDMADSLPVEMEATKAWMGQIAESWEVLGEGLNPANASSIDRIFISSLSNATQQAILNLEARLVQIERNH